MIEISRTRDPNAYTEWLKRAKHNACRIVIRNMSGMEFPYFAHIWEDPQTRKPNFIIQFGDSVRIYENREISDFTLL